MIRLTTLALLAFSLPAAAQVTAPSGRSPFVDRFAPSQRIMAPTLKPAVTVVGEIVRIGDLVENAGAAADVPIFRAPDLGQTGSVPASRVIEAVLPHEIVDLETRGLTEVLVTRASQAVTSEDLEARIVRALADRQRGMDASDLTLTFDGEIRTFHIEPATEMRIVRLNFDPRSGRFDVLFERTGSARNLLRFTGTYAETFEAAVLTRPLAAGDVVRDADINIVRRPKAEFAVNVITAADRAIGLAPRRAMRPGDVLRQTDLAKPELVARNDNVTITYEVPGIMLTMRGKAIEAGAAARHINVLNVQSNRPIQATVAGRGHVVVAAPPRVNVTAATTARRVAPMRPARPNPTPQARASAE